MPSGIFLAIDGASVTIVAVGAGVVVALALLVLGTVRWLSDPFTAGRNASPFRPLGQPSATSESQPPTPPPAVTSSSEEGLDPWPEPGRTSEQTTPPEPQRIPETSAPETEVHDGLETSTTELEPPPTPAQPQEVPETAAAALPVEPDTLTADSESIESLETPAAQAESVESPETSDVTSGSPAPPEAPEVEADAPAEVVGSPFRAVEMPAAIADPTLAMDEPPAPADERDAAMPDVVSLAGEPSPSPDEVPAPAPAGPEEAATTAETPVPMAETALSAAEMAFVDWEMATPDDVALREPAVATLGPEPFLASAVAASAVEESSPVAVAEPLRAPTATSPGSSASSSPDAAPDLLSALSPVPMLGEPFSSEPQRAAAPDEPERQRPPLTDEHVAPLDWGPSAQVLPQDRSVAVPVAACVLIGITVHVMRSRRRRHR